MHIKTKISSFTLAELLVVLVLTSFLMLVAMSSLNWFQSTIVEFKHRFQNKNDAYILENTIQKYFYNSDVLYTEAEKKICFQQEQQQYVVCFKNDYVLLNNIDTLFVKKAQIDCYLEKMKVSNGVLDAMEINYNNNASFFISKKFDAAYYMNYGD